MQTYIAALSGFFFALGLIVSKMIDPAKVQGFLDFFGNWDPSLVWVMGGAVCSMGAIRYLSRGVNSPIWAPSFSQTGTKTVDAKLIAGSILFGVGWGLSGYCPGPAIVSIPGAQEKLGLFLLAMIGGMALFRVSGIKR